MLLQPRNDLLHRHSSAPLDLSKNLVERNGEQLEHAASPPDLRTATCMDSQELVPLLPHLEAFFWQPNSSCHRFFLSPGSA
jgi:hypothetical protein